MAVPLGSIVSGLTSTTTVLERVFSTAPLVSDRFLGARYTLGSAAAPAILGMILSGCSEPTPAPISGEPPPPPNQKPCSTNSTSPYCVHQREVLAEMQKMREEGHHSDQALTALLVGGAILITGITTFLLGRRRGRNFAKRQAKQVQSPNDTDVRHQRLSITDFKIGE